MANRVQVIFEVDKDASGRTILRQIQGSIRGIGNQAKSSSSEVDSFIKAFKVAVVVDFFKSGAQAAFDFGAAAVKAFNEANNAALGLQSVAKFKGFSGEDAVNQIKNLDLVKDGMLSIGEASTALKNLLQAGFGLDQSIELIKRFGDSAAFGKQAALTFGQAVVSTSEGIRNQNSILSDNGGITKNLSVILKERGFQLQDLSDKVKGAAAREALYNGLLVETQAQVGDAAKRAETFAGGQDKLAAASNKVLVSIGKLITESPILNDSFRELGRSLDLINIQLQDSDSQLSKAVKSGTTFFASFVLGTAAALEKLETFLNLLRDLENQVSLGFSERIINFLFPDDDALTKKVKEQAEKIRKAFADSRRAKPGDGPAPDAPFAPSKKDQEALKKAVDDFNKVSLEKAQKYAEAVRNAEEAVSSLQSKLQANPLVSLYDEADRRQRDFLEKFKEIPKEITEQFKKANQDVLNLDIFKGRLSQASLLSNLILERDKLQAGFGGKSQLSEADQQRLAQLQRASLDAQLASAQRARGDATTALQRNLANEQIISATSDISRLTPEQVDIRLKALNDSIGFQQQIAKDNEARARQEIQSRNDNTAALVQVGNRLAAVEGALSNFKEGALTIKIDNKSQADIDLGSVNGTTPLQSGSNLSNSF